MTSVQKISPKLQQMYKKGEAGFVEQQSFVGYKYRPCQEKKLKIALLNEAGFMVKSRFEIWNWSFANICAPVTEIFERVQFVSFPY